MFDHALIHAPKTGSAAVSADPLLVGVVAYQPWLNGERRAMILPVRGVTGKPGPTKVYAYGYRIRF
jgi:hypothetical protein